MKNLKFILLFNLTFMSIYSYAQLTFMTDNYTRPLNSVVNMSTCNTKDFGFTLVNNSTISKYDLITFIIYERPKNNTKEFRDLKSVYFSRVSRYPTKKRNQNKKEFNICIICENSRKIGLIDYSDLCQKKELSEDIEKHEYKIYITGRYIDGQEQYWDKNSNSYKKRFLYDTPEIIYKSETFSFKTDENSKKEMEIREKELKKQDELEKKFQKQHNEIEKKYLKVIALPYLGESQPRKEIFEAYELLLNDLMRKKDYETLEKVNDKLLSIEKKYKKLKKSLKNIKDTDKILEIILKFPY